MKLLDEKGIGTVWSICKEKFALVGHTHNYAGSGSPGGSANSAIGVVDYNSPDDIIQIGISGPGISGDEIAYIAGYVNNPENVSARIKDVSKDALQSWLGLGNLAYQYNVDWSMISGIPAATATQPGIMSAADKSKLNGIAYSANNYTLPTASDTTLGGIKVSTNANGSSWPICVDGNGLAQTKILGLEKHGNAIKSIAFVGKINKFTRYSYNTIDIDCGSGNDKLISLPSEAGTLALTSDIPTKTSQLTNDSTFLTSADKYTLPVASTGTLGGIRASSTSGIPSNFWPIIVDNQAIAYTSITGLKKNNDGTIESIKIKEQGDEAFTTYGLLTITINNGFDDAYNVWLPSKDGTIALTRDIPNVSKLCNFNFVNSISECKSDRINFLLGLTESIDLNPLSSCNSGTILLIAVSGEGIGIANTAGDWSINMEDYSKYSSFTAHKGDVYLVTVKLTKIYCLKFTIKDLS